MSAPSEGMTNSAIAEQPQCGRDDLFRLRQRRLLDVIRVGNRHFFALQTRATGASRS
jgi:hypothetical protein